MSNSSTAEAVTFATGSSEDRKARLERALDNLQREIDDVRRELGRRSVFENLNIVTAAATVARETAKYELASVILDSVQRLEAAEAQS